MTTVLGQCFLSGTTKKHCSKTTSHDHSRHECTIGAAEQVNAVCIDDAPNCMVQAKVDTLEATVSRLQRENAGLVAEKAALHGQVVMLTHVLHMRDEQLAQSRKGSSSPGLTPAGIPIGVRDACQASGCPHFLNPIPSLSRLTACICESCALLNGTHIAFGFQALSHCWPGFACASGQGPHQPCPRAHKQLSIMLMGQCWSAPYIPQSPKAAQSAPQQLHESAAAADQVARKLPSSGRQC